MTTVNIPVTTGIGADTIVFDGWVGSVKSRYVDAKRFIYRIVSYKRGA